MFLCILPFNVVFVNSSSSPSSFSLLSSSIHLFPPFTFSPPTPLATPRPSTWPPPMASSTPPLRQGGQTSFSRAGSESFRTSTSESKAKSFWSILAKRAKTAILDDGIPVHTPVSESAPKQQPPETSQVQAKPSAEGKPRRADAPALQKGFEAIASSLTMLSDTIGNALEEGLNRVETKASDLLSYDSRFLSMKKKVDSAKSNDQQQVSDIRKERTIDSDTQLKASRDVTMAMAAKAKLLLRELKTVKADLAFAKDRCMQLEEENKRLRDSLANGMRLDEEDLVRAQLETLLAEKARLAQENAYYTRENQYLREVVAYHQLKMQDVVLFDESIVEAAELSNEPAIEDEGINQLPEKVISVVSVDCSKLKSVYCPAG